MTEMITISELSVVYSGISEQLALIFSVFNRFGFLKSLVIR